MAVTIKRGDECPLAVRVELNGQAVDVSEVETAEFCLGKRLRKLYPGEVEHDAETGDFLLPLRPAGGRSAAAGRAREIHRRGRTGLRAHGGRGRLRRDIGGGAVRWRSLWS